VVPLVIVEGPDVAYRHAVQEMEAGGWLSESGFSPPYRGGRIVRTGLIQTLADVESALLAALAGQGIVAQVAVERNVIDQLVDDLRRLGQVDHRLGTGASPPEIQPEARALLGLLAEGHSLGEAAALLGLSRRTADRRLATGRRLLGTKRTTEAITLATRLGWLPRDPRAHD
jgi:DNA-binding CsgD family transcriptional regulator